MENNRTINIGLSDELRESKRMIKIFTMYREYTFSRTWQKVFSTSVCDVNFHPHSSLLEKMDKKAQNVFSVTVVKYTNSKKCGA